MPPTAAPAAPPRIPAPRAVGGTRDATAKRDWALAAVWTALAAWMAYTLGLTRDLDFDTFHQAALFRELLATGQLPLRDPFAYTPTRDPVIHHEWGMGAVAYAAAVASGWGLAGLAALRIALVAATGWLAVRAARAGGAPALATAMLAPLAWFLADRGLAPVRAQMVTFLGVAALVLWLWGDRRGGRRWIWPWLLVWVAWLNLHGGAAVGAVLFALHTAGAGAAAWRQGGPRAALRRTRHLLAAGAAMAVLAFVGTAYGPEYVRSTLQALWMERPRIGEWDPLWSAWVPARLKLAYLASLLLVAYAAYRREEGRGLPGLLLVLATAYFAARHVRMTPIYGVVWLAHVPVWLGGTELARMAEAGWRRIRRPAGAAAAGLAVAAAAGAVSLRFWTLELSPRMHPQGAVDYLAAAGFRGHVMTPFEQGAFVTWALYPRVRVSLDSRYEAAYPARAFDDALAFYESDVRWREVLEAHPTHAVLVPPWSRVDSLMLADPGAGPGWARVYRDRHYTLLVRRDLARALPREIRPERAVPGRFP